MIDKWRQGIESKVSELEDKIDKLGVDNAEFSTKLIAVSSSVDAALKIHAANAEQLANNTSITLDIKNGLDRFKARAEPSIVMHENMVRGAELLGRFADFAEKWGKRILWIGIFCASGWLFLTAILHGAKWSDAVREFINTIK